MAAKSDLGRDNNNIQRRWHYHYLAKPRRCTWGEMALYDLSRSVCYVGNNFSDTAPGSVITLNNTGGLPQTINNILIKQNHLDINQPLDISLNNNVNGAQNVQVSIDLKVSDHHHY